MSSQLKGFYVLSGVSLLLLAALVVICATPLGPLVKRGAATPEEAIFRSISHTMLINFRVRAIRPIPGPYQQVIVLYSSELEDGRSLLSIALVEKRRWGWYFASGLGRPMNEHADNLWIEPNTGRLVSNSGQYFVIYGRGLSPEVKTVEERLSYGQIARATVEDGIYIHIVPDVPSTPVLDCGLSRALDANGHLLYETTPQSSFSTPGCPD